MIVWVHLPPANEEVIPSDRAYYVGSQLGRISKIDKTMSLYNLKIKQLDETGSISALVYSKDNKDYIIDRFELSTNDVHNILNKNKKATTLEEMWLLELINVFK